MAMLRLIFLCVCFAGTRVRTEECYYNAGGNYGFKYCASCCGDYGKHFCCDTGGSNQGVIVGAVLGGTVVFILAFVIAICCMKNFSKRTKRIGNSSDHRSSRNTLVVVHGADDHDRPRSRIEMSTRSKSPYGEKGQYGEKKHHLSTPPPMYTFPAGHVVHPEHLRSSPMPSVS